MSIAQREGGSLGLESCPPAPWRGVRWRHIRSGWLLAGALWVGSFQTVLVAIPSSVRYDLPLCSVAEHWQTRYCHAPALVDPLWRDGERKGFTCLSSLSRWETAAHGVPEGKRKRKEHLGTGGAIYSSLVPPTPPICSALPLYLWWVFLAQQW